MSEETKKKHIEVVVDIEATGRFNSTVFCFAACAQYPDKSRQSVVYYFPHDETKQSPNTMKWWNGEFDKSEKTKQAKKAFLKKAKKQAKTCTREQAARAFRAFVDELYATGHTVSFYSDFTVFDLGFVSAFFGDYGLLPMYLENDTAYPAECVDHTTFVKGLAHIRPTESSDKAFKKLKLPRTTKSNDHDPLVDVELIMDDVQNLLMFVDNTVFDQEMGLGIFAAPGQEA
ncbi:MAG: hypothetical protein ACTSUE_08100 [Promethearchaeota archaeon]